jgi:hypothetical protein
MRVQIRDGVIIGYGYAVNGDDTHDGAPDDYEFGKYTYTPNEDGSFNSSGFTLITTN